MKMRKMIVALLLALVMIVGNASVLAAEAGASVQPLQAGGGVSSPQAEETVWCTRVYNGILQKRLWSLTYERWLTEWIDIGPITTP